MFHEICTQVLVLCFALNRSFHVIHLSISQDDVIKWEHFPRYWPFVRGIHRYPVNSSHTGQWRGALMFSVICAWINAWVNNRDAADLRRYRAHYDVTVMLLVYFTGAGSTLWLVRCLWNGPTGYGWNWTTTKHDTVQTVCTLQNVFNILNSLHMKSDVSALLILVTKLRHNCDIAYFRNYH